jgi:cytochrome oxidase Cu insertion factor (SCO1/SenC/PrrC family)
MLKPGLYALAAVLALIAGLMAWQLTPTRQPPVVQVGEAQLGGPFALTDHNGLPRSNSEFRGRTLLIYFGYTTCPDVCPTELAKMGSALTALEKAAPARAATVQPLFITVDPERDTIAILKQYVPSFHPRLIGLTGSIPQIEAVLKAYHVYVRKTANEGAKSYLMDHTSLIYLMGPDGQYVAHFTSADTAGTITDSLKRTIL